MKKMFWLVSFLVAMLFVSNVMAEVIHPVKKGDTVWGIAKKYGVKVKEIKLLNPEIEAPKYIIQIGWELKIPAKGKLIAPITTVAQAKAEIKPIEAKRKTVEKLLPVDIYVPGEVGLRQGKYKKPGGAPTRMDEDKAFGKILLSDEMKRKLEIAIAIKSKNSLGAFIEPGDRFLMTYGSDGVGDFTFEYDGLLAVTRYLIEDNGIIHDVRYSPWCDNWFRYPEKYVPPPEKVTEKSDPPVVVTTQPKKSPPPYMAGPPIVTQGPKVSGKDRDTWDLYFGGGNYENRIDPEDNNGWYWWSKGRIRPRYFDVEKNDLGIKSYGLGFVGFMSGGEGVAAKYFDYDWYEIAAGGTAKVYAKNSDYDFDAMIFRLLNEGTWMGTGGNKQTDYGLLLSAHGNIYNTDPKALFLPKREWNIEGRFPFSTKVERGEEVNNRVIEGNFTQWLYLFQFDKENSFAISPGLNLGGGYEWAAEDGSFIKAGGAFELSSRKNVLGAVSPYNWKWQGGEIQRHPISAYVSADGMWNAIKASQVTSISEEELRGLDKAGGSKLLKNPADYL